MKCRMSIEFLYPALALTILLAAVPVPGKAVDSPEASFLQRAQQYHEVHDLNAAVIELKNALQQNPESLMARWWLGVIYLEQGDLAGAEKELMRARQLGAPANILVWMGEVLLLQRQYQRVLSEIPLAPELEAKDLVEVHAIRGEAHLGINEPERARAEFENALAVQPDASRALVGLAQLAMHDGKLDETRQQIERALAADKASAQGWAVLGDVERLQQRLPEAELAYGKVVETARFLSLRGVGLLQRASTRIEMKNYQGAAKDIRDARPLLPGHLGVAYAEGLLAFHQNHYAEAKESFEQVAKTDSNYLGTAFYLGASLLELGNQEQAERYLGQFLSAHPRSDQTARLLGETRLRRGDYAGATAVLKPLLGRNPEDVQILTLLSKATFAQGDKLQSEAYLRQAAVLQPGSAAGHYTLGLGLMALGEAGQGVQELEQAVALAPESDKAELILMMAYLKTKQFDKALTVAQQLQTKRPESPDPLTLAGIAYIGLEDLTNARAAFEQALKIRPGALSAATNLATLDLQTGNPDGARAYYQQILEYHSGDEKTLVNLAKLELRQGNLSEYVKHLDNAARANPRALEPRVMLARLQILNRDPLKALTTLGEVREFYSEHPSLMLLTGEAQLASGQTDNAVWTFKKLVGLQPQWGQAYYDLAGAYAVSKDTAGMRGALLKALALEPGNPVAGPLIARLVSLARDAEEARGFAQALQQTQPDHPAVIELEAQMALRAQQPQQAMDVYHRALQRFPDNNIWLLRLAELQWNLNDQNANLWTLTRWLQEHPQDAVVMYALANNYLVLGRYPEATAAFAKVVELAPNTPLALNNLAWLLRNDDPKAALTYAERAAQLSQDVETIDTLGEVLLKNGQAARAVEVLRPVTQQTSVPPKLRYRLAQALVQIGERKEAHMMLEQALGGAGGEFAERADAEALLKQLGER